VGGRRVVAAAVLTRFRDLRLFTPPGVFAPRSDAGVLLDAALPRLRGDVLDLCSGSGVLALAAAPHAASVLAVDMSRMAAGTIRVNSLLNRRRVEVRRGDLFAAVGSRRFDVILTNPPYVPTPPGAEPPSAPRRGRAARADATSSTASAPTPMPTCAPAARC